MSLFSKRRKIPYHELLSKVHGGIWKYDISKYYHWICEDGRYVIKCTPSYDDGYIYDTQYFLYTGGGKNFRISPYTAEII